MAKLTPMKAIRKKCLECSCGSFNEVKLCPIEKYPPSIRIDSGTDLYRVGKTQ